MNLAEIFNRDHLYPLDRTWAATNTISWVGFYMTQIMRILLP